jgi:hypothetical protein
VSRAADEAEVAREELGAFAIDVDEGLPHNLGVPGVAGVGNQGEELQGLRVAVQCRKVVVAEEDRH